MPYPQARASGDLGRTSIRRRRALSPPRLGDGGGESLVEGRLPRHVLPAAEDDRHKEEQQDEKPLLLLELGLRGGHHRLGSIRNRNHRSACSAGAVSVSLPLTSGCPCAVMMLQGNVL